MAGALKKKTSEKAPHKDAEIVVEARGIVNKFGTQVVHDGVNLAIRRGETLGIVGGSGAGKSVLLRTILGLHKPTGGEVLYGGEDILKMRGAERAATARRGGVMFQHGALFSNLTVLENTAVPLKEFTDLSPQHYTDLSRAKLRMAGLGPEAEGKKPAELSGGMVKRAALARALALDPEILFLDEPTAGLDPMAAASFDDLIRDLSRDTGVTIVIVTHDLDTLFSVCDRVAVLVDKKVTVDTLPNLMKNDHPWIKAYFHGPRARAADAAVEKAKHDGKADKADAKKTDANKADDRKEGA